MDTLLTVQHLSKRFGRTVALDDVSLEVASREIHAILGENGAGKTTLTNILYGLVAADQGRVLLEGRPLAVLRPHDAIAAGIGMVHQHFMLVANMTVLENLALGHRDFATSGRGLRRLLHELDAVSRQLRIELDPESRIENLSVGEQQRVEIVKALLRRCRLLILDEPTAVLAPHEVNQLFELLRQIRAGGAALIFISHKLEEVKAISDRITVLRAGRVSGRFDTAAAALETIAAAVAPELAPVVARRSPPPSGRPVLRAEGLTADGDRGTPALRSVSFEVNAGEILGVAGVDGNGQAELAEVLVGARPLRGGRVLLFDRDLDGCSTADRLDAGIGHIPAERRRMGLFPAMTVWENLAASSHREASFRRFGLLRLAQLREWAAALLQKFDVRTPGLEAPIETLSGGNQQKLVVARELARSPALLVAVNPTRGVDLASTRRIHETLLAERERGTGVLLVSTEISEILELADRILVLFAGRVSGPFAAGTAPEEISRAMIGAGSPVTSGGEAAN